MLVALMTINHMQHHKELPHIDYSYSDAPTMHVQAMSRHKAHTTRIWINRDSAGVESRLQVIAEMQPIKKGMGQTCFKDRYRLVYYIAHLTVFTVHVCSIVFPCVLVDQP